MRLTILFGALLALFACSDALGPLTVGEPYLLWRVNGQPIPWTPPSSDSQYIPATITQGSVTLLNGTVAERQEAYVRWVLDSQGDSIPLISAWSQTAAYRRQLGLLILTYHVFSLGAFGPSLPVETLYISPRGGLTLRTTGLVPPLDSIVRVFCTTSSC